MKAKDIININEVPEEECQVCVLHTEAYKKVKMECPCCGGELPSVDEQSEAYEQFMVGEVNYYEDNQQLEQMPVTTCPHCGKYVALKPIPIIYNGNHDIYYTGGSKYVPGLEVTLPEEVKENIVNYTQRIRAGETTLTPSHLGMWIEYSINHYIAEKLKEHGLKF